ncbi:MAG TPA: hypothetical protein VHZ03_37150, partial [Trebonia sp.]|nr:hypothetical protein [Trebonia sp.]
MDSYDVRFWDTEHPDGRRGPAFPWARVGAAAVTATAAHAGLHVTGRQHADRVFVCAATPIAGARVTTPSSAIRGELWCPPRVPGPGAD